MSCARPAARSERLDVLVVVAVVTISMAPHLGTLGFYSDDWAFLAVAQSPGAGPLDTWAALLAEARMRPLGELAKALQLHAFGAWPLGYHLVNLASGLAICLLLRRVARALGLGRGIALGAALLYAVMPHHSTLRLWFASGIANLSLVALLVSARCDLAAVGASDARRFRLRAASIVALVAGLLCYELALPLFVALALVATRLAGGPAAAGRRAPPLWGNLVALAAVTAFKLSIPDRFGAGDAWRTTRWLLGKLVDPAHGPGDDGLNLPTLLRLDVWTYGLALPGSAWSLAARWSDPAAIAAALVCGALAALGVRACRDEHDAAGAGRALRLGSAVVALGWAIFLTNGNVQLSATGTGNRTAGAASLGLALAVAGALAAAAGALRPAVRARLAGAGLGLAVALGALASGGIAGAWRLAAGEQARLLAQLRADLPAPAPGTTLLLDGACRYVGPAPVFEAPWDLAGAWRVATGEPSVRADLVQPTLRIEADGLHTHAYDTPADHPYGERLLVYHARRRRSFRIDSRAAAERYFSTVEPDRGRSCPPAYGGWGEAILDRAAPPVAHPAVD